MDDQGHGFSKAERLRKRKEFLGVYERGDKIQSTYFVLYMLENGRPHHRLGITASRKIGRAVVRNRIKRRLREIFRTNKQAVFPTATWWSTQSGQRPGPIINRFRKTSSREFCGGREKPRRPGGEDKEVKALPMGLIRVYQALLAPILPSSCRFAPSCSEYMYQAIDKFGVARGAYLGLKRVLRCHPWHPGGTDPIP